MAVDQVDAGAVAGLRGQLGGPQRSPQEADLSLMVLAQDLSRRGDVVRLVSDDFKITTSSHELGMPYSVVSPSVFLFTLSRQLHGEPRELARRLFRRVRHGEMEYLLSRRDLYNVEDKLTWLMDNLLQTVTTPSAPEALEGSPAALAAAGSAAGSPLPTAACAVDDPVAWAALLRELHGEHVRKGHLAPFKDIMPHLEPLKGLRDALVETQALTASDELTDAVRHVHTVLSELKGALQLAVGNLPRDKGQLVLRAYAEMLPDAEMVAALIHANLGELADCEDHLDNVALLSLAAGVGRATIEANYLGALVNAYREEWNDSRMQFELTSRLAAQAGDADVELRSLLGAAITRFLSGDREGAERAMEAVQARVDHHPEQGVVALEEFGDHFTNFGAMHLAAGLYDEALECAVEAQDTPAAERLVGKLRRAHLSMGLDQREISGALRALVDHANNIDDPALRARYEEAQRSLHDVEALLDEPLHDMLPEWTSASWLPAQLREWLEVVRAENLPGEEGTLLVCFAPEVGMVGVLSRTRFRAPGIEQSHVRIDEASKVRLVAPTDVLRRRHRVRGIVVLHEEGRLHVKHSLVRLRE
jgi:hypothetical protein